MKILKLLVKLAAFFFGSTLIVTILYRFVPIFITPLMLIRATEQVFEGKSPLWHHDWVEFSEMSPHMAMAVIASEDNRFASHNGFDLIEIKKAMREAENGGRRRGASTISQQTAKNVFLWPQSSWIRKGFEVYFTFLIEIIWGKERIMEVYLNSIEMGSGIYGVEAAAQQKFNTTAKELSANQCALIAATLPNPRKFDSANPSRYMLRRQKQIRRLMHLVEKFPPAEKGDKKGSPKQNP